MACFESSPSQPRHYIHSPCSRSLQALKYLQKWSGWHTCGIALPLKLRTSLKSWLLSVAQYTFVYSLGPVLGVAPKSHVGSEHGVYFRRYTTFQFWLYFPFYCVGSSTVSVTKPHVLHCIFWVPFSWQGSAFWFLLDMIYGIHELSFGISRMVNMSVDPHTQVSSAEALRFFWVRVKEGPTFSTGSRIIFILDVNRSLPRLYGPSSTSSWVTPTPMMLLGAKIRGGGNRGEPGRGWEGKTSWLSKYSH